MREKTKANGVKKATYLEKKSITSMPTVHKKREHQTAKIRCEIKLLVNNNELNGVVRRNHEETKSILNT